MPDMICLATRRTSARVVIRATWPHCDTTALVSIPSNRGLDAAAVVPRWHSEPHIHWPLLVIDDCPFGDHAHIHPMTDAGPWLRAAPCSEDAHYFIELPRA